MFFSQHEDRETTIVHTILHGLGAHHCKSVSDLFDLSTGEAAGDTFAFNCQFVEADPCTLEIRLHVVKDRGFVFLMPVRDSVESAFYTQSEFSQKIAAITYYNETHDKGFPYANVTHLYADLPWIWGVPNLLSITLRIMCGNIEIAELGS